MIKSVLFVCTGNTCRSFMAEYLLRYHASQANWPVKVASAGTHAFSGDPPAEFALAALAEVGIDGGKHRSRKINARLLEEYDLVLVMTTAHYQHLAQLSPHLAAKICLLKEFVKRKDSTGQEAKLVNENNQEILDPYGQSLEVYRQARQELAQAIQLVVEYGRGETVELKIALGADHGGYQAKQQLLEYLQTQGFILKDFGTFTEEACDYPDIAQEVTKAVTQGDFAQGILICGTGIGMSVAANKQVGIRAALCHDTYSAQMARSHNDSNVLCLGARVTGPGLMQAIVDTYLQSSFVGGHHAQRVEKIEQSKK